MNVFELADNAPQLGTAVIKVVGVGGGGGNAVEHMVKSQVEGVDFICANTDLQALSKMQARTHLQLGQGVTRGLGA
ncbi:MAG TPA: cell division protein FtsZ, partial [Moraxellaceae bacterium]|nr:cell division protein FtsZ [Moraxellaceae bacterium]